MSCEKRKGMLPSQRTFLKGRVSWEPTLGLLYSPPCPPGGRRDAAALHALLAAIRPGVLRRCSRFLPCPQDAEDGCQDVLLQMARNIHRFEERSRFSTWLHVSIGNSARQAYRSFKRRAAEQAYALPPPWSRPIRVQPASSRDPALTSSTRWNAWRRTGRSGYREIAEHLGIPEGIVKSRIHQACGHVRETLMRGM